MTHRYDGSQPYVEALIARLGGRLIVRPHDSPAVFGWSSGTSRNMVARGELPALRHFGGRVTGWLVTDLVDKLAGAPPSTLTAPRSPGRPRGSRRNP